MQFNDDNLSSAKKKTIESLVIGAGGALVACVLEPLLARLSGAQCRFTVLLPVLPVLFAAVPLLLYFALCSLKAQHRAATQPPALATGLEDAPRAAVQFNAWIDLAVVLLAIYLCSVNLVDMAATATTCSPKLLLQALISPAAALLANIFGNSFFTDMAVLASGAKLDKEK